MKRFLFTLLSVLGILLGCARPQATRPVTAPAATGGDISGGGTIVVPPTVARPELLDLYLYRLYLYRQARGTSAPSAKGRAPSRLGSTPFLERFGVDWWEMEEDVAFAAAVERLKVWRPAAPRLTRVLYGILRLNLRFFYTDKPLRRFRGFWLPPSLETSGQSLSARTLVAFDPLFGPVIDAGLWNQLDLTSQAAAFIHEALRHLRMIHPEALSEEQLQRLTATIMLTEPRDGVWLESYEFLGSPLMESFHLPLWSDIAELAQGIRYRLYYRWVERNLPELLRILAEDPALVDLRRDIITYMKGCGPVIHEAMEINCAANFTVDVHLWHERATKNPRAQALLDRMELRSGQMEFLWTIDGKPGVIQLFYSRLFETLNPGVKAPFEKIRTWAHPIVIREYLEGIEKAGLSAAEHAALEASIPEVSALFTRYFAREIVAPEPSPAH